MTIGLINHQLSQHGLVVRGGFLLNDDDCVMLPVSHHGKKWQSLIMVGHIGSSHWRAFSSWLEAQDRKPADPMDAHPIDTWSVKTLSPIAADHGGIALFPFGAPLYPFIKWALRGNSALSASPLGMLIDADHGLYHAFRGAMILPDAFNFSPHHQPRQSPCTTCDLKPCLHACPVHAFKPDHAYDYQSCQQHLNACDNLCMDQGCLARNACPIGSDHRYHPDHMHRLMKSFFNIFALTRR